MNKAQFSSDKMTCETPHAYVKEEIMEKAEKAYCKKCAENPCAIIIRHGCLCMQAEMFLKSILKEL